MSSRRLIVMRHATAAGAGSGTDRDRPLTSTGREEAARVGQRLEALDAAPDRVLSSPALRCRQTLEAVLGSLEKKPRVAFEDALYNAAPAQLLHVLSGDPIAESSRRETVLLLAHNPGVSMLAFELGGSRPSDQERLRAGFAPATFALFEVEAEATDLSRRSMRLIRFERPKDLA